MAAVNFAKREEDMESWLTALTPESSAESCLHLDSFVAAH